MGDPQPGRISWALKREEGSQAGGRAHAEAPRQEAEATFRAERETQPVGEGFSTPDWVLGAYSDSSREPEGFTQRCLRWIPEARYGGLRRDVWLVRGSFLCYPAR